MFAPGRTDRKIIEALANETNRVLALPEFRDRFEPTGMVRTRGTPDGFGRKIEADYQRWKQVVKASGASVE